MFVSMIWALCALTVIGLLIRVFAPYLCRLYLGLVLLALSAFPALAGPLDPFIATAAPRPGANRNHWLGGQQGPPEMGQRDRGALSRGALHLALRTSTLLVLKHELAGKEAIDPILRYIRRSVPDAIIGLDVLTDLSRVKME